MPFIFKVWIVSFIIKIISYFIVVNNCQCFLIPSNFRKSHHASVMILIIIHHTVTESLINTREKKKKPGYNKWLSVIHILQWCDYLLFLPSAQSEGHTNISCSFSYSFQVFHPRSLTEFILSKLNGSKLSMVMIIMIMKQREKGTMKN